MTLTFICDYRCGLLNVRLCQEGSLPYQVSLQIFNIGSPKNAPQDISCFVTYMGIQPRFTIQTVLSFLEFLYSNAVSPRVIANYVSSLKTAAKKYKWDSEPLHHQLVSAYLRSISINSTFTPTPRGTFGLETLTGISKACDRLQDPVLYRAILLTSFFAFLRMSNIAPHSRARFDPGRHLLRQEIIFASPGAHILLKWSKTMQNRTAHQFVQIPQLPNSDLCPVTAIQSLLDSRPLPPTSPLFVHEKPDCLVVIDTTIRDALKSILLHIVHPSEGFGFHVFRRSGATVAFDHQVPLEHIMAHGLWRSNAVWNYLQTSSVDPSSVPLAFASLIR